MTDQPKPKIWRFERLITEHAFDKLRLIDCSFSEFAHALDDTEVIEELPLADGVKELVLTLEWLRPLHVVVVVDEIREEERILTVYEPDDRLWTDGYRRRR